MVHYMRGKELEKRGMRQPLTPLEQSGRTKEEVIAAIEMHKGFPNVSQLAKRLRINESRFSAIISGNPHVREAWHAKVTKEAKAASLKELFDSPTAQLCSKVPEALEHKRKLVACVISTFVGRPTLPHLARHVLSNSHSGGLKFITRDPVARAAAEAKFFEILNRMSGVEIATAGLHVHASKMSKPLAELIAQKLQADKIKVKLA
ncbi:MAG: hypothetical protein Q8R15_03830 [Candidatus Micrarchaeota archaeon]|nr:hypothetical protein [Candidatus Micrarchaeota archaeon]